MKAVNLLPNDQRGSAKTQVAAAAPEKIVVPVQGSAFGAYVVLGLLAFAVAATAVYVLATNTVKDRQAELARVQREAADTTARAKALQGFADFQQLADQRITTVRGLAESRFDWEQSLRDMSRALPSDVHLKSLKGTTSSTAGGGTRGAIQAPAIELSGCTANQAGVARLMSRLRNVRGVTRVSLTKSDKDASGVVATTASADGSVAESLCPKGQPPAFEMVVFFERAAVSASALPAAGATAPGQPTQAGSTTAGSAATAATTPPADPAQPAPAGATDQQPQTGTTTGVAAP